MKNIVQGMSEKLQAKEVWWVPCRLPEEEYLRQPIDALFQYQSARFLIENNETYREQTLALTEHSHSDSTIHLEPIHIRVLILDFLVLDAVY